MDFAAASAQHYLLVMEGFTGLQQVHGFRGLAAEQFHNMHAQKGFLGVSDYLSGCRIKL